MDGKPVHAGDGWRIKTEPAVWGLLKWRRRGFSSRFTVVGEGAMVITVPLRIRAQAWETRRGSSRGVPQDVGRLWGWGFAAAEQGDEDEDDTHHHFIPIAVHSQGYQH